MQAFIIKTVAVKVPEGIDQQVVVNWLRENFATVMARPVTADYVSIEAFDDRGVNQALDALQNSASLLQHRTMLAR
jgi:hypothetical protein